MTQLSTDWVVENLTMSSVEIADLTEKNHAHVMRDIRKMLDELEIGQSKFGSSYLNAQNKEQPCFELPKDLTITLVAGYKVKLRHRIVTRWQELEKQKKQPAQLSRIEILQMALESEQKLLAANERIEALEPKAKALQRIAIADGSLCLRDAAKSLQVRPKDLADWLQANGWIYKRAGVAHWLGYQVKIQTGLLEHKVTTVSRSDGSEKVVTQVRITPKGLSRLGSVEGLGGKCAA